ncbi:hypothetical protein [uncultured Chryseobacterium sp.]|uniref:hypothetical protein n=1 Tax=uncultured Chryseobacterium sp. TaxID=259322 RepID=UPI0025CF8007|nr:hypothetical protein [uncultured Chryseobacterium sp.]
MKRIKKLLCASVVFISGFGFFREKVVQKNIVLFILILAATLAIYKAGKPDFKILGSEQLESMTKGEKATSYASKVFFPENYLSFAEKNIITKMQKRNSEKEHDPVQVTTKW